MVTIWNNSVAWFKDHSPAILATLVAVQNSHLLGTSAGKILAILQGLFSVLGGT